MGDAKDDTVLCYVLMYGIDQRSAVSKVDLFDLLERFSKDPKNPDFLALDAHGVDVLYIAVRANLLDEVKFLREQGAAFDRSYPGGTNLLSLAVLDVLNDNSRSKDMINLLLTIPELDHRQAIDLVQQRKNYKTDKNALAILSLLRSRTNVLPLAFSSSKSPTPNPNSSGRTF